jgi:hypothetical protein
MATKASAVFGRYGTRPLDLHGDWYSKVSFYARCVGMELIAHCKDPGDLRLPVGDDWRETLCGKMSVTGPDRRNARGAMDALVKAGFLHHEGAFARLTLEPERAHFGSTSVPVEIHSGSTPDPLRFQFGSSPVPLPVEHAEIVENESASREGVKQEREGGEPLPEEVPEPEQFIPARRPLGEPPPGFVDAYREPEQPKVLSLADRILCAWKDAVGVKLGKTPGSTKRVADSAAEIAEWLVQNPTDGLEPLAAFQAALKQYLADEKLRARAWPINWLLDRMPGYLAAKQPEQQKVSSPTHQEWIPPDYEAGNREAEARADREREEWFEQHPEYRAAYEADQRRMLEEYAESRKVIRIEDAPKPLKRAAPMTEAQRQERIRLLQAQAEQIRAANAAQQ